MRIALNGTELHYEVSGAGTPLIMVHSNCKDIASLDLLAKALVNDYKLYRVDSRGHGESMAHDEYHYQDMADDMFLFIKQLGLEGAVYYGHGDGGVIGLLLASQHPGLLSKMVVSGACTTPDELDGWDVRKARKKEKKGKNDPRVSMMLREPHISADDLKKIDVPTFITIGEYDVVNQENSLFILRNIPKAEMHVVHNGDRDNYIIKDKAIGPTILEWLKR